MSRAKEVEEVKHNEHLGDLDEFTESHIRLIHSICQRYLNILKRNNLEYDDLFQIATLGFMKAYERFDPEAYDVKFSTYCFPMMQGEIRRYLRDESPGGLKVSRGVKELCTKLGQDESFNEDAPTLAARYGVELGMMKKALRYFKNQQVDSMDKEVYDVGKGDSAVTLAEQLGTFEDYSGMFVKGFLEELDERDKQIVLMVMHGGYTQREIGDSVGVTQVQVSRLIRDRIGPLLKGYMDGADLETIDTRRKRPKKEKEEEEVKRPQGRPKTKHDYSYLNKKKLSLKSTRELVLDGYEAHEIVYLKGVKASAVYAMKKKVKEEQAAIPKPYDEPIIDIEDFVEAEQLLESAVFLEEVPVIEEKEEEVVVNEHVKEIFGENAKESDFDRAKRILEENPDVDRVFLAEETGLTPKQVSDLRWRIKARGQGAPVKAEKKLEFNLHASSGKATKNEVMSQFAMIMETLTALGANSLSYYISVQSPAELDKEQ